MSQKDKTDDTTVSRDDEDAAEDVVAQAEPEAEPEPEVEAEPEPEVEAEPEPEVEAEPQEPTPPPGKKSAGGSVAWLALFLSMVAVAAIGYTLVQDWRARGAASESSRSVASAITSLDSRIDASDEALASLDRGISELGDASARATSEIDALRQDLDNRIDLLDSLPQRMSTLENSMAAMQGVSAGARDTWLLAEAEYYMQIANAQLQLAGNPHLAALALGMADERIVQLANPALTEVRRALSDELAALEVMDKPDIEGVTLNLASLARVVDSLPLRQPDEGGSEAVAQADEEQGGVGRAWNSVKSAVSSLVKVTPADQVSMPLIAPDAIYFLRTNLTLQLQSARLALLRGEKAVFEQSLDDAAAWLRQYFDTESGQVSSALQTISEMRDGLFTATPPDISESLRLLRQFKLLSETAQ